ncbi:hypothetical protein CAC42_2648 [Sphaceloma murrayae]|uniref:J domain-containing protein n=1 Tax=Sphaceloma murrayae TaxID=2082308 RepID=A0A2K1QI24_9PEZI|nr:hypothetical protein CAC42_2648 [Sphaceloma murrayae]
MSSRASGSSATPNGDAKGRSHNDGSSTRAYTTEQKAAVLRVKRCSPTAFYDILGLETQKSSATDAEVKKAYRKLSLLTHPDKNGFEGADEAFKLVSRAFQILSDPDKRTKFDKFGGDPDNRFSSASSASPFSGFSQAAGASRGGPMFEEEISPEEMFRQFFGGGMGGGFGGGGPFGGGLFDTGPGFVFNLGGGPGIRVHQFGGGRPRQRPHNHDAPPPSPLSALQSLLPIILIFIFPILSSIFSSLFGGSTATGPSFRFDAPVPPLVQKHTSGNHKVAYYVDPVEVADYTSRQWSSLDRRVEGRYIASLEYECQIEDERRRRLLNEAMGFFFTDQKKVEEARRMEMRNCDRLRSMGYQGRV